MTKSIAPLPWLLRIPLLGLTALSLGVLAACPPPGADDDDDDGVAILGSGSHSLDGLSLEVMADSGDDLSTPRDLEFNPLDPSELWVVNMATDSATLLVDPGSSDMDVIFRTSFGADHFLRLPSSLAFADDGTFSTAQEEDDFTQGPPPVGTPADFMGPTRWPSDLDIWDGGHLSHLDMLHNSPNGAGIAWEGGDTWWVFDGYHESLTRYNFNEDHGPGGTDHTDGEIARFAEGEVSYVPDVPSHMEVDRELELLYVADTGNNRIAVLDVRSGEKGGSIGPNYDFCEMYEMDDEELDTLVEGEDVNLRTPSGLALRDGVIYVGDNETGFLFAFDQETGDLLDWLDLGFEDGALTGLEFDEDGNLWLTNTLEDEVLRLSVAE